MKLFEYMNEAGITPDQRSFELMITAHVVNRDMQAASVVLAAMVSVSAWNSSCLNFTYSWVLKLLFKGFFLCGKTGMVAFAADGCWAYPMQGSPLQVVEAVS